MLVVDSTSMSHPAVDSCAAALRATSKAERQAAEDAVTAAVEQAPSDALYALITAVPLYQDTDPALAQLCAIRAKNWIKNEMSERHNVDFALVKNALLQALPVVTQQAVRRLLVECARWVHAEEEWTDLVPLIVSQLSQGIARRNVDAAASQQCLSALQLVYVITRNFKNAVDITAEEHEATSAALLPMLPPLFAFRDIRLAHMTLKVFESLVLSFTPAVLKNEPLLFDQWMRFVLSFATEARPPAMDLSPSSDYVMYIKCLKRIGNISLRFIQLAARKGKKRPKVAQRFAAEFGPSFVSMWVAWLEFVVGLEDEQLSHHSKVTVLAMRFLRECAAVSETYGLLPIDDLNTRLLFFFFPFNSEDEELWTTDVNEYLRRLSDPVGDKLDTRHAATKAMITFVSAKRPFQRASAGSHLRVVLLFVQNGLQQPFSRATDGYLHILGVLVRHVMSDSALASAMPSVLTEYIAPLLTHENTVLRAKAIWICGLYRSVRFPDPDQFGCMLRAVLGALDDPEPPVRMQVIASLVRFIALREARVYLRECLTPLAEECVRLIDHNNSDFAVNALEALVDVFGPELSSCIEKICRSLLQRCRAVRFDLIHAAADGDEGDDEEPNAAKGTEISAAESLSFSLEASLRALSSAVEAVGYHSDTLAALQEPVCLLVLDVLRDEDIELAETALQIFDRVAFFLTTDTCPAVWDVVIEMHRMVTTGGGVDLFKAFFPILDNLCTNHPNTFAGPESQTLALSIDMCRKMLCEEVSTTPQCVAAAPQLMTCLLLQLRAYHPGIQMAFEPIVALALQSLAKHAEEPLRIHLCTVVWAAVFCDAAQALAIADGLGATEPVLRGYCDLADQPQRAAVDKYLTSSLDRKTHILGMCAYLSLVLQHGGRAEASSVATRLLAVSARFVRRNVQVYQRLLKRIGDLLSGRAAAEEASDGSVTDSDADSMEDDECVDGEASEPSDTKDDDDDDELEIDSAIDTVCEVSLFRDLIAACPPDAQRSFYDAWPTAPQELPSAVSVSLELIAAREQLKASRRQVHVARALA